MSFQIKLSVETSDIDMMGHVNNIVYLRWAQEAAIAHWETAASLQDQAQIAWIVLRHEIDYKLPARLGDEVVIQTWVGEAAGLTFERHTKILRAKDLQLLAQARTLWCPINPQTGHPRRVSLSVRSQFSATPNT